MCNGFPYHPHGYISLLVELFCKVVDTTFIIVHTFNQFQVKLGIPWLSSMQVVASPFHKCLNFPHYSEIKNINHILYHPYRS